MKSRKEISEKVDVKLEFRLGINMGDVVKKDNNLIGDGVNIAKVIPCLNPMVLLYQKAFMTL